MSTPLYEGLFLLDSSLVSKDWNGLQKHIHDILGKQSAEVVYSEKWPDRRLAYEVKGCRKGTYYLTYFNASPNAIDAIRRDVELSERILRSMFIQEPGVEGEMKARESGELEPPPAELAFGRDRPGFDAAGRPRRGPRPVSRAPAATGGGEGAPSTAAAGDAAAAPKASEESAAEKKGSEGDGGAGSGEA